MEPLQAPEGDVVAIHPATIFGRILVVLLMMLPGVGLVVLASQSPGLRPDPRMVMMAIGGALFSLGLLAFAQQNQSRVVVRADGIERWGLRGKLWALRWADMAELRYQAIKMRIYYFIPAGTNIFLTLRDRLGKKRRIPGNMKGMDVLAERVADQQTGAQFPEARAALDRGEEVKFGKVMIVDREKVSVRKLFGGYKSCPIGEIERVSVENGMLRIRQRGKFLAFGGGSIGSIPNVFLFLRLLDTLVARPSAIPEDREFAMRAHVG